jgi:hypothetical protein
MPETLPPPEDLASLSLADIAALVEQKRLPPIEQWHPERVGLSDMRITRDGTWFHEGSPIRRPAMVRLFATILRREADGSFALVTPVEKLAIEVEDAPFVAVELKSEGEGENRRLAFRLNTDEVIVAGPANGLHVTEDEDGPHPYLHVRGGLEASIARPVYYELAELAIAEGTDPLGLWSGGAFLSLAPA